YLLLAGILFARRTLPLPPGWRLGVDGLQVLGFAMLGALAAYLVACRLSHGRIFHLRGHHFRLPSLPLALLQVAMAAGNWMLMAGIVYALLPGAVGYPEVLAVLLLGAVAAAAVHMPAGIGVLEAVFAALLDGRLPRPEVLAAVLTYRAFYYLLPLAVALVVYATLETRRQRQGGRRAVRGGGS
ncbi:MAG TPA: YbhN family protein, partial [Xanthomonadaceae bacterium]|nr:YbhN family protein [Xanthomonadaceae bacterium]